MKKLVFMKTLNIFKKKENKESDFASFFSSRSSNKAKVLKSVVKEANKEQEMLYQKFMDRNGRLMTEPK